jgi:hypothetical protein
MRSSATLVVGLVTAIGTMSSAWAEAQGAPAIRTLGPITRVSTTPLSSVAAAIPLRDGRVYVNDIVAHRVLLFDSTLTSAKVVADTTDATASAYGPRAGALIRFRGDTVLLIDQASVSMLVLGPAGTIVRVMAIPRPEDALFLAGLFGRPAVDARGRLLYYSGPAPANSMTLWSGKLPTQLTGPMASFFLTKIDSASVVRIDLATRALDTIAAIAIPWLRRSFPTDADGNLVSIQTKRDLLPVVDDWAMLPDGTIAVVRGRDYHVDWLSPDGHWSASPKMPFDWQHVSDDFKRTLIDSATTADQKNIDGAYAQLAARAAGGGGGATGGRGGGRGGGSTAGGGSGQPQKPVPNIAVGPDLSDLPDYMPPFARGAISADADGRLWIRTSTLVKGQPVYDIVNRNGVLTDRVTLPPFRTIAGFAPGVIYMAVKDSAGVVHLERARVK